MAKYDVPVRRYFIGGKQNPAYYAWLRTNIPKYKLKDKQYAQDNMPKLIVKSRSSRLRRLGLTLADYNRLWQEQKGLCAICNKPEIAKTKRLLAVDHDHKTGKVRRLLCMRC